MKTLMYLSLAVLFTLSPAIPIITIDTFSCVDVIEIPQTECEALVTLYNGTNGPGWTDHTNWLLTNTPSDWFGVTIQAGHVWSINLFFNNLIGSIPIALDELTGLEHLYLGWNQLSGMVPPEIGNITTLTELDLGGNQLYGILPPELGNLTNLNILYLFDNQFTGEIPSWMAGFSNLIYLMLEENLFSGNIPAGLGNLKNLQQLGLNNNQLTGTIPLALFDLPNLTGLSLSGNHLGGDIPPEIIGLFNMRNLDLSRNQFTGGIPPELANLTQLAFLNLSSNPLAGEIPVHLGLLSHLMFLSLANDQLNGSIPVELGSLTDLEVLQLQNNQLQGNVPSTFKDLVNLYNPGQYLGLDGLDLDYNLINVPPGYPDPNDLLQVFLSQKDPDWQLYQGFTQKIGSSGGEFTSLDGRTSFLVPAGALTGDVIFTFLPQPMPAHDYFPLKDANNSFDLSAVDSAYNTFTLFNLPITVTLTYTDADISSSQEGSLGLYDWDISSNSWMDAVNTCPGGLYTRDLAENTLILPLCHLTEFSLFGYSQHAYLPVVLR